MSRLFRHALLLLSIAPLASADIGTAFTYQGSLENGSGPVTDTCDFRFGLWDADAGGSQAGVSPQTVALVDVVAGSFTVALDFGVGAINGDARWLEIEVQCPGDAGFVLLSPRVELTPAPHALRASTGVGPPAALEVDSVNGRIGIGTTTPDEPLTVVGTVHSTAGGFRFPDGSVQATADTGDTLAGLSCAASEVAKWDGSQWVCAADQDTDTDTDTDTLGELSCAAGEVAKWDGAAWACSSDGGGDGHSLDAVDGDPIDAVYVNDEGRVGIGTTAPTQPLHVVGTVMAQNPGTSPDGSTVRLGGPSSDPGLVIQRGDGIGGVARQWEAVIEHDSTLEIRDNTAGGLERLMIDTTGRVGIGTTTPTTQLDVSGDLHASGTIASGNSITIDGTSGMERIVSSDAIEIHTSTGRALRIEPEAADVDDEFVAPNSIAGWQQNSVTAGVVGATIAGGGASDDGNPFPNIVTDDLGTIGGGYGNQAGDNIIATNNARAATVGGGSLNIASGHKSTVSGGHNNQATQAHATISGGLGNTATNLSAVVGGGGNNDATGVRSTVSGGESNTASGSYSSIPGGENNLAGGAYSLAAGRRAKVRDAATAGDADGDEGSFAWADSTDADFTSTGPNQFLIRAGGGVGINTDSPEAALDVAGLVRSSLGGFEFPDGSVLSSALSAGGAISPDVLGTLLWPPQYGTFFVGGGPRTAAFDGTNIWVTNVLADVVTKLRASDGANLGTFAAGDGPFSISFDGANIWVANANSDNVTKLRASDGANLGTFAAGDSPFGIAFDGANIWVANRSSDDVTKLRASDGANLGTFAAGDLPTGIGFDGANIWVANAGTDDVTKLRASDGANLGTFAAGSAPQAIAFDGANIWVANFGTNDVTKLRASSGANLGTFAAGNGPQAIVFDGANIWVANRASDDVTKLRASDGANLGTIAVGNTPWGIGFDGANIWVANGDSNDVTKVPAGSQGDLFDGLVELTGGTEATLLNGSGFLLIGNESSPNLLFDTNEIQARNNGGAVTLALNPQGGNVVIAGSTFNVDATNGRVGIGTGSPTQSLHVVGNIVYTGTITDISDERLKTNIAPVADALEKIQHLRGVYFNMTDTPEQRDVGLIAQDVQSVLPEAVSVVDPDKGYLGVAYPSVIPLLVEAIKEQNSALNDKDCQIQSLDTEVTNLKSEIDELKSLVKALADRQDKGDLE